MRSPLGTLARAVRNKAPVSYASQQGSIVAGGARQRGNPEAQLAAMGSVGTIFAIVDKSASATSMVHWDLLRHTSSDPDTEPTRLTSHAALDILNRPNPHMTGQHLFEVTQQHMDLVGEGFWIVVRGKRVKMPLELWPVRPDRMIPVPSATDFIAGWIYCGPDGEKIPLDVEDVIFFHRPDPLNFYRGMGPVQALLTDLDAERYSAEWNRNFFINSAEPGGLVVYDKRLDDDEFKEVTTRWREQHKGVANAHRVAVLEQGAKWVERKFSMRDMQFAELRRVSREIILEAFGFSKTMLGQTEDVNRATAEAAEYVFSKWHLVPRLERLKGGIDNKLLPLYNEQQRLEFQYENPVPDDEEKENARRDSQVEAVVKLVAAGYDPAGALEMVGLPEVDWLGHPDAAGAGSPQGDGGDGETQGSDTNTAQVIARLAQQLYLATPDKIVLSTEEAREVIRLAGGSLDGEPPEPPAQPDAPTTPEPPAAPGDEVLDQAAARLMQASLDQVLARHGRPRSRRRAARPRGQESEPGEEPPGEPAGDLPRELSADEQPDLGPMQEAWEQALEDLLDELEGLEADQKADLVQQVRDLVEAGDIEGLRDLEVPSEATGAAVEAAMLAIAEEAAQQVVDEAAEQGITISPDDGDTDLMGDVATVVAAVRASRLAASATVTALRAFGPESTADTVADAVELNLDELSREGPRPLLGGALTGAQNEARIATLRSAPEGALYANEVNDTNTCGPCREVDGRWLGNISEIEQVMASYPAGGYGGYVLCRGRERCRGTITGVWRPRTTGDT